MGVMAHSTNPKALIHARLQRLLIYFHDAFLNAMRGHPDGWSVLTKVIGRRGCGEGLRVAGSFIPGRGGSNSQDEKSATQSRFAMTTCILNPFEHAFPTFRHHLQAVTWVPYRRLHC